ncbi:MauE/DoxX family redox-associated membrane protein [Pirellulaceae bacterium SH449]
MASNQSTPAQRKISVVIALVLLSACAAKAWAMVWLTIPVTRLEIFFNVLIIQLELVLALWLLSRIRMPLSLLASAIFFLFAVASNLYAIWRGKSSCGCFGNIEVSPVFTLGLNIVILLASAYALRATHWTGLRSLLSVGKIGWTIPLCLSLCLVAILGQLGRLHFAPQLILSPEKIDLGLIELGSQKEVSIPLKNISDRDLNIWGGKTNCTCATIVGGLPALVAKGSQTIVRIVVRPTPQLVRVLNRHVTFRPATRRAIEEVAL